MKVLLIEAGNIQASWLQHYVHRYAQDVEVVGFKTIAEAEESLKDHCEDAKPDIIVLDSKVPDALSVKGIPGIVEVLPKTPIAVILTGKVEQEECERRPQTWVYEIKTDVTQNNLLQHLRNIVAEVHAETPDDMRKD